MFRNCADVQILSNTAGRPPIAADIYPQARKYNCYLMHLYGKRKCAILSFIVLCLHACMTVHRRSLPP